MSRRSGRRFADKDMRKKNAKGAGVPIPKFASIRRDRWANFGIDKETSKSMIPVPLLNPKLATALAEKSCELRVRGTGESVNNQYVAGHERDLYALPAPDLRAARGVCPYAN